MFKFLYVKLSKNHCPQWTRQDNARNGIGWHRYPRRWLHHFQFEYTSQLAYCRLHPPPRTLNSHSLWSHHGHDAACSWSQLMTIVVWYRQTWQLLFVPIGNPLSCARTNRRIDRNGCLCLSQRLQKCPDWRGSHFQLTIVFPLMSQSLHEMATNCQPRVFHYLTPQFECHDDCTLISAMPATRPTGSL